MKHTALPWKHTGNNQSLNAYAEMIHGPHRSKPVASCPLENYYHQNEAIANAEFIVKACNCHEELVEACNYALEQIQRTFDITDQIHMPPGWLDADIGLNNARGSLQETLAKATK